MHTDDADTPLVERKVVRRGLLAGLAALGAAAAMKVTGASKAAANDTDNMIIGRLNVAQSATFLEMESGSSLTPTLYAQNGTQQTGTLALWDAIQGITHKTFGHSAGVHGHHRLGGAGVGVAGDTADTMGVGVVGRSGPLSGVITRNSIGVDGQAAIVTGIGTRGINVSNGTGVAGYSNNSDYIATGDGAGRGVHGKSGTGIGVLGEVNLVGGVGTRGTSAANGTGVLGVSNNGNLTSNGTGSGFGVEGRSGGGIGVKGVSQSAPGVRGESGTGPGVSGGSPGNVGVAGFSDSGVAMRGISSSFVGVVGVSTSSVGLWANTAASGVPALFAENVSGGNRIAAQFNGNVIINGALTLSGAKAAAVTMPDGSTAMMYCQEAPEPFFEDFGRAQLAGGVAQVLLEPEFASLVLLTNYMVFLTPGGDSRGWLYVSRQDARGFEVREAQGGTSNVPFTYRIVAKRKDIPGVRLQRLDPQVPRNVAALQAVAATKIFGAEAAMPGASGPGSGGGPGGVTVPFTPSPFVPDPSGPNPFVPGPIGPVVPGSGPSAPSGGGPGAR